MNLNSILTKVVLLFLISFSLFIGLFIGYYIYETQKLNDTIQTQYITLAKESRENRFRPHQIIQYAKDFNLEEVKQNPKKILKKAKFISAGPGFDIFLFKDTYYMHMHTPHFRLLLKDTNQYTINTTGFYILSLGFLVYLLSFFWIINALLPLKELKDKIEKFSSGDLNIECKSDKKDEIADVANEFDNAVKKISLLLESRQLFLRTVMHELKTPIAKGRIVSELIEDEKQKNRMADIFDKLNFLINDFAKVEEVLSQNYELHLNKFNINVIINSSIDMLMIERYDDKIEILIDENQKIVADLDLISMAIKNLLDNALKYSSDHKVNIEYKNNTLYVISKGDKLSKPLEEYYKPFHNDTKSKNHGMGLGLYIVYSILNLHNYSLDYEHRDQNNIFKINF